ncbi:hypothetical protein CTheo_7463 [Ceratobasidium theobromae]|uniref:Deacetylase sirtuin-type domain-containing protein n=1 Tax=Ceratobasidium theobromae TaxID=1582974 RepID=A0A5N5QCD4_9AGAM|nr:hypothetical protein CTheo_7463 [Ceratobasidium theobromae]
MDDGHHSVSEGFSNKLRGQDQHRIPVILGDQATDQEFYRQIQSAIGAAQRITIVCGAGISTSAGIPDFRSADGLYNHKPFGLSGSELFDARMLLQPQKLLACGRAMGTFRTKIRVAQPTHCHKYITMLHETGRLLRCYTQNIDGLQTRGRPDMLKVILELHGNIEQLRCNRCGQVSEDDPQDLDRCLIEAGFVQCKKCDKRASALQGETKGPDFKWNLRQLPPGLLLPQVLHNEASWELECNGMGIEQLEQADGCADLFLVIGTSLKVDGAAKLVRSLAKKVHRSGGVVIYVNRDKLSGGKWAEYFDVQLQVEIDMWAVDLASYPDMVTSCDATRKKVMGILQAWHDQKAISKVPPLTPNFPLSINVSCAPMEGEQMNTDSCPPTNDKRFLFLICHSGALATLAQGFALQLLTVGEERGWECRIYVVILSGAGGFTSQIPMWTNYVMIVIHLSDFVLRLHKSWESVEPGQGIRESGCSMKELSEQSHRSMALMICAADELLDKQEMSLLEESFRRQSTFEGVITCLNLSFFEMKSWIDFMVEVMNRYGTDTSNFVELIKAQWMQNEALFENTDLVVFAHYACTTMLLASQFADRPLGKPLPRIEDACPCDTPEDNVRPKSWEVLHDAVGGRAVRDVRVVMRCSLCCQAWKLETSRLVGVMYCHENRFCVMIVFRLSLGWI